ncbi:hypothetical protein GCM10023205_67440 [Yinghuangia aomiensis]|uniref:PPM-type phosphatase domain-containing protein n=1 Tax=Yinghuangia aomiensis TaxID=676205 RepID=A0ABP9I4N5_9ACTN
MSIKNADGRLRRDVALMYEAAAQIGVHLDVRQTAQDIVDVLVPALGDLATVDLSEMVCRGEEPAWLLPSGAPASAQRVAVAGDLPPGVVGLGGSLPVIPRIPQALAVQSGEIVRVDDPYEVLSAAMDPARAALVGPADARISLTAPLYARGLSLGAVTLWLVGPERTCDDSDVALIREIVSRGALAVDNARRYAHEHGVAEALQRRLLPRSCTSTSAADTAAGYLPAETGAGVGGDWFDAIPLPSARIAFVVGDVVGRGLSATATMARLRTAVQTLADIDLQPDELLTHIDDLVLRLAAEAESESEPPVGATCVYAVYDPVAGHCRLASAGHPPPAVLRPGGVPRFVDVSPGPPLGVGGLPFEVAELQLDPGSVLAFYTDGLTDGDDHDPGAGMVRLAEALKVADTPGRPLANMCGDILAALKAKAGRDDTTLLLARTRTLNADDVRNWEFPAEPQAVGDARSAVVGTMDQWGLYEMTFVTELVISELVTNAMRYAAGPIGVRLIRDDVLVCEVSDPSNTQPRLRRARYTDEGGRGLFLVAQMTDRWGCRYRRDGKTIWTEQAIRTCGGDAGVDGE